MIDVKFSTKTSNSIRAVVLILSLALGLANSMDFFQVKLVENNNSRLIATSNDNYAISSSKLAAKNWRAVSVNGDEVLLLTLGSNEKQQLSKAQLGADQMLFVEQLRDEILNSANSGHTHISSASGGGAASSYMSSSSSLGTGSSYSSSSSSSSSDFQQAGQSGGQMSFSATDENNFSISKSDLPLNWSRVFFNNDLITVVTRNGEVRTLSLASLSLDEATLVERLKREVADMRRQQADQFSHTMSQSIGTISNVFNNIMGRFPRPPDYQNAVGNMFGNDFPFGSGNSPFSSAAGWPFGGEASSSGAGNGVGAGAFAFAGRR